ncbi:ATP-dependent RNA helicase RhlE [Hartmannibacter diazotrophicus]|uniref:DEAD-box ATP-dependent RNA helicase RhpA n=1 Tax=Hartmannibacter diazotrophicus TaxID=1482074 RepID=A0A2C9D8I8_9HYPH|nr:DEAD/DEAH box helicase [Hartmannibacter diazotrophicus]SON56490.1 ATP-dependent RNA helicase RhlE [Hartmannibacter diazotrophicus]
MNFSELGLSDKVLSAVEAAGYTTPTPIQEAAIPHVLQHRDIIGVAQTGTGKTASFTLPMLTLIEKGRPRARMPRTLILEPTRELAAQVEENFSRYGVNHRLTVALLIGGVSFDEQDKKLARGADVLIATPGRLLDHFERGKLLLNGVEILVIDEADRMLDMGFIPDIERICKLCTRPHQSLFFSATMPPEIQRLADTFLNDPVKIEVARPASTAKTVSQNLVKVGREAYQKRDVLRSLIRDAKELKNAIIFCNRKRDVATLYRSLEKHGFNAGALHGDMEQRARMATLDAFRKGTLTVLVASDVAARGLDIPEVSHVFNFDIPTHAEDYVHRIGRTGRAGRLGTAITLVGPADAKYLASIEKLIGEKVNWMDSPVAIEEEDDEAPRPAARSSKERRAKPSRQQEEKESAPVQSASAPEQRAPSSPRNKRSEHRSSPADGAGRRPNRERGRYRDDDEPVIGLGDHVPAFLLRPVRTEKQAS